MRNYQKQTKNLMKWERHQFFQAFWMGVGFGAIGVGVIYFLLVWLG